MLGTLLREEAEKFWEQFMANYENPETFRITAEAYSQHIEEQYHEENDNGLSTPRVENLGRRIMDALRKFLRRSEP